MKTIYWLAFIGGMLAGMAVIADVKLTADPQCYFVLNDDATALCPSGYEYSADDGATWTAMGAENDAGNITLMEPLNDYPDGENNIQVRGKNAWGHSPSVPFEFIKGLPVGPTNVYLVSN